MAARPLKATLGPAKKAVSGNVYMVGHLDRVSASQHHFVDLRDTLDHRWVLSFPTSHRVKSATAGKLQANASQHLCAKLRPKLPTASVAWAVTVSFRPSTVLETIDGVMEMIGVARASTGVTACQPTVTPGFVSTVQTESKGILRLWNIL